MALRSQQVSCNDEKPTLLYPPDADGVELVISASGEVYLGDSTVDKTSGFLLDKNIPLALSLGPDELVYGLGAVTVYVLATKNA